MTESANDETGPRDFDVAAVSALDEPNRRRLYEYVCSRHGSVTRDEASEALSIPRQTAAFHLDKLAEVGLLEIDFARQTGRTGPGAGRPAKLYRRSDREFAVRLPERSYEVAGLLLAQAVDEADATGESPRAVLARHAEQLGREIGADSAADDRALTDTLARCGYEPVVADGEICLANCPFRSLARTHTALVCGMNLALIDGVVQASGSAREAHLAPHEGYCCVRLAGPPETSGTPEAG